MDIREQEFFIAIVEKGSLSKASEQLYVSQSSLSQFLARLESAEGTKLIVRAPNRPITLTDAGNLYYECAKRIEKVRNDYLRLSAALQTGESNKLRFGINAETGAALLAYIASIISPMYPDANIITVQQGAYKLQEMVADGELDIAFSAYDEKNPKLEYIDFPVHEVVLVLRQKHKYANLGTTTPTISLPHIPLHTFENESFVSLMRGTVLRSVQDSYFTVNNFSPSIIKIETHNISTAFRVIENGICIGLLPYDLLAPHSGELCYIGLNPPLYYHLGAYYSKTAYQSAFIHDFLKAIHRASDGEQNLSDLTASSAWDIQRDL